MSFIHRLLRVFYRMSNVCALMKGMKGAEGLSIGVQVIAPRFCDERALRVMKELDSTLSLSQN